MKSLRTYGGVCQKICRLTATENGEGGIRLDFMDIAIDPMRWYLHQFVK